jgi:hypothetical protein
MNDFQKEVTEELLQTAAMSTSSLPDSNSCAHQRQRSIHLTLPGKALEAIRRQRFGNA